MNADTFMQNFGHLADAPGGVQRLREMVLRLAIRGLLTPRAVGDDSALDLVKQLEVARQRHLESGKAGALIDPVVFEGDEPFSIPSHWCWTRLAAFGAFVGGGTPSKQNDEFWNGTTPWVSPKDMKQSYISDTKDHISEAAIEASSAKLVDPPALLAVVTCFRFFGQVSVLFWTVQQELSDGKQWRPQPSGRWEEKTQEVHQRV